MIYRVELTGRATRDLKQIYEHIHTEDSAQAFAWFNGLEALVYSLDQHPERGAITTENKRLRHLLYGNKPHIYRIIYRVAARTKKVEVVHIRHGARDEFTQENALRSRR